MLGRTWYSLPPTEHQTCQLFGSRIDHLQRLGAEENEWLLHTQTKLLWRGIREGAISYRNPWHPSGSMLASPITDWKSKIWPDKRKWWKIKGKSKRWRLQMRVIALDKYLFLSTSYRGGLGNKEDDQPWYQWNEKDINPILTTSF